MYPIEFSIIKTLKIDAFSKTDLAWYENKKVIVRTLNAQNVFKNCIGKTLANREAKALKLLEAIHSPNLPKLIYKDSNYLIRSYIEGTPLNVSEKQDAIFFKKAFELISQIHKVNVVHNDLEKAENWIKMDNGNPGIIDFQIAMCFPKKSFLYNRLCYEDIRHVIKNKVRHCLESPSEKELKILNRRPKINKIFRNIAKRTYQFFARKIFNYSDRDSSKYSN